MTEPILETTSASDVAEVTKPEEAKWPLSYKLQPSKPKPSSLQAFGYGSEKNAPKRWWSYRLYRGPDDKEVEILYSRNKAQSEIIAQHFVNEPIVGFDMEWPWNDWKKADLQNKVGLIQIASESKIGLFHIGLHPGKTTNDIIAPTLRKIIETPTIGKVGVAVLKADFGRLARYFGLKPKGAIESSHLFRLVKFGSMKPQYVSVKFVSLAQQVEEQLGLPLYKGDVRTSNWSKPLNQDQINYAASDAYAGFMLYHCMNAKRLAMDPVPPLPVYAEMYPTGRLPKEAPIILDNGDGTTINSDVFFKTKTLVTEASKGDEKAKKIAEAATRDKARVPALDPVSKALFGDLLTRRAFIAQQTNIQAYRVISDTLLASIALKRPRNNAGLIALKGIGKFQVEKYGSAWLEVISLFLANNGLETKSSARPPIIIDLTQPAPAPVIPRTPRRTKRAQQTPDSSPAFASPPPRTPQLHTGLSFTLAETGISKADDEDDDAFSIHSDDTLSSIDFGSPSQRRSSGQKRKRDESPTKSRATPRQPQSRTEQPDITPINLSKSTYAPSRPSEPVPHISPSRPPPRSQNTTSTKGNHTTTTSANPMPHTPITAPTHISPARPLIPTETIPSKSPATHHRRPIPPPLSPTARIARNKLLAFSRLVARKLPNRSANAPPIISDHALDLIVRLAPTTEEELERIPGVDGLLLACERTGTECLRNVVKFVGRDFGTGGGGGSG